MDSDLIHDRGRGAEVKGTRTTVYDLLPFLLNPATTEADICREYNLTAEQVAVLRAYALGHLDEVMDVHLKIEQRHTVGWALQPPAKLGRLGESLQRYRAWRAERDRLDALPSDAERVAAMKSSPDFPTFNEWFAAEERSRAEQQARAAG